MQNAERQRIEWVDIFKGIAILLVVVGHCSSPFTRFIYQFHMAAFFFISGYTTKLGKKKLADTVAVRVYSLLLPFLSAFFLGLVIDQILLRTGTYGLFSANPYPGTLTAIRLLLRFGDCYVYWLGAAWFLMALLGIHVLEEIIFRAVHRKYSLAFFVVAFLLWLGAYAYLDAGADIRLSLFNPLFILMGQVYYCTGILFREKKIGEAIGHMPFQLLALAAGVFSLYWFGMVNPNTVDYPSRKFNFPAWDYLAALGGIVLLIAISQILQHFPKRFRALVTALGRNTIGILLFHFLAYKAFALVLYRAGVFEAEALQSVTPPGEYGAWWWAFAAAETAAACLLWFVLKRLRWVRAFFGQSSCLRQKLAAYAGVFQTKITESALAGKLRSAAAGVRGAVRKNPGAAGFTLLAVILWAVAFVQTGITCNDELQTRLHRMGGLQSVFSHYFGLELGNRAIRVLAAFNLPLGFLFENQVWNRVWQTVFLIGAIALFGGVMARLFDSKKFGFCCSLFFFAFLPITYELSVPNAFVTLVTVPFMLLMLSFLLYIRYAEKRTRGYLAAAMAVYFLSMMGYEFLLTFVLLFPAIAWYKMPAQQRSVRRLIRDCIVPFSVGVLYLILLFVTQAAASSELYSGTQMTFVSLKSSFDIIWTLALSALPGYFLWNGKYQYLFRADTAQMSFADGGMFVVAEYGIRAVLIVALLCAGLRCAFRSGRGECTAQKLSWWPLVAGILYLGIPSTPNSITSLYQGQVTATSFTSLPVSLFLYAAAAFACVYLLWLLARHCRTLAKVLTACAVVTAVLVQTANGVTAQAQKQDYLHLTMLENALQTNTATVLQDRDVYAEDWFRQNGNLAIHDGYFTQFAEKKGLGLTIQNEPYDDTALNPVYLGTVGDDGVLFQIGDMVALLLTWPMQDDTAVRLADGSAAVAPAAGSVPDGDFYVSAYHVEDDGTLTPAELEELLQVPYNVGTTLQTAQVTGVTNDGWCQETAEIRIRTGSEGELELTGYVVEVPADGEVFLSVNGGETQVYPVQDNVFELKVQAPADSEVTLSISTNFAHQAGARDDRIVSFILTDLKGN